MDRLEKDFEEFRQNTIGYNHPFKTCYGEKEMVYADWTASGRLYYPIERRIASEFGPYVGNTHSESNLTGTTMTKAYHMARENIKRHVNADKNDVIITAGFGMTAVANKLQRILGLRISEKLSQYTSLPEELRPVIFVTHMEHHSNQTSWLETIADVVVLKPDENGLVDLNNLEKTLKEFKKRNYKIGAFTSCSNVTGIMTPYHDMAKLLHEYNGICFVDFAASAPYVQIDMHPEDPLKKLDGIYFSPHKFLGGPGTSGVLVFDSKLYNNKIPDHPGGGTVDWTNPWGGHRYSSNIETREDGGTPGFLQAIKTSMCINLKEKMNIENMEVREKELINILFSELGDIEGLNILAKNIQDRLGIFSIHIKGIHYNLMVKLLNDRFGIQSRGGCSCAGTYGHYLLNVDKNTSKKITSEIDSCNLSHKPGWVRLSVHPMMTNDEAYYVAAAVKDIKKNIKDWERDYNYIPETNEFQNIHADNNNDIDLKRMFEI